MIFIELLVYAIGGRIKILLVDLPKAALGIKDEPKPRPWGEGHDLGL